MKKMFLILVLILSILLLNSITFANFSNNDFYDFEKIKGRFASWVQIRMIEYPIIQAISDKGTKGSGGGFIFFNLTIETELYFAMYIKDGNKIKLIKVPANQTDIYEDTTENNAYLVKIFSPNHDIEDARHYNIHVPKNSISNSIDLNLKK
jgi:hypothetical protein